MSTSTGANPRPRKPRILAFSGSLRKESWNTKLLRVAVEGARAAGAEVTVLELRELGLPLYDGDLEAQRGLPESAGKLKALMIDHGGFLIASPENNSSLSSALKNAIDWASRPAPGEPSLACFRGKVAGIMAASPGALGGLRGLMHLRSILESIHTLVVTEQKAIPHAERAFDGNGKLKEPADQKTVEGIGARVATVVRRLAD